jgi:hypothetical protein
MRTLLLLAAAPLLMLAQDAPNSAIPSLAIGHQLRQDDSPVLASSPDGSVWAAWLSFEGSRDDVAIRQFRDGKWGSLQWVPNASGDSWLPQVGVHAQNRVWVVWTQMVGNNWDLYARRFDLARQQWSALTRLSSAPQPDINPRLASDGKGRVAAVWRVSATAGRGFFCARSMAITGLPNSRSALEAATTGNRRRLSTAMAACGSPTIPTGVEATTSG